MEGYKRHDVLVRRTTFFFVLLFVVGCSPDPGRFAVEFDWGKLKPPDPGTLQVRGEVTNEQGSVSATTTATVAYEPGMELPFPQVPNHNDLFVVVAMYPLDDLELTGSPWYIGRSDHFNLQAGTSTTVRAVLEWGPKIGGGIGDRIQAPVEVIGTKFGRVSNSKVHFQVRARSVQKFEVAQDIAFSVGRKTYDEAAKLFVEGENAETKEAEENGYKVFKFAYDLNENVDCAQISCEGLRRVVLRGLNGDFNSDPVEVAVNLDTMAPEVTLAAISYKGGPENPLPLPTKATVGTTIVVSANTNEAMSTLSKPPTMIASHGVSTLVFRRVKLSETRVDFEATVTATHTEGVYTPLLHLADLVGNVNEQATFSDPQIVVTTREPVLTVDQDAVSYVRSPLGNAKKEHLGSFTVPDGPYFALAPKDSLENTATVRQGTFLLEGQQQPAQIRIWEDQRRNNLLRSAQPNSEGDWPRAQLRLPKLDVPTVFVSGVDAAGNESQRVRLDHAWFVATSGWPAFGTSPHVLTGVGRVKETLIQPYAGSFEERSITAEPNGQALISRASRVWTEEAAAPSLGPSPRAGHALAYDSARGRVVLFGGWDGNRLLNDIWEWSGTAWTNVTPRQGASPSPREDHAMVYDSARGRVVLFGGFGELSAGDTWEWNGTNWIDVTPARSASPPPRSEHAMAYDSARGRVVLFGGLDKNSSKLADTWEWDGKIWEEVMPTEGRRPDGRSQHAMAYDITQGRVVLSGGSQYSGPPFNDTWAWDGNTKTWEDLEGEPLGVMEHAMTYDSAQGSLITFGGWDGDEILRDTWKWDGGGETRKGDGNSKRWKNVTPPDIRIWRRLRHAMVYDSAHERIVLFGGWDGEEFLGDTWVWDGTTWTDPEGPDPRQRHAMAYDNANKEVVLFGGAGDISESETPTLGNTWTWNGLKWKDVYIPEGKGPSPRTGHAMTYDGSKSRIVLFGGMPGSSPFGDTWEWDGTKWTNVTPKVDSPNPRIGHAMVYDSAHERVVLFGGSDGQRRLRDTRAWNGSTWANVTPENEGESPSPREGHAMAYDSAQGQVVLFGGSDGRRRLGDTWTWDGTTWANVTPENEGESPSPREGHAMAYDGERGRVVLFGGSNDLRPSLDDTWEWDGATWKSVTPQDKSPRPASNPAMAYDRARGQVILLGKVATWAYATGRPAFQMASMLPVDMNQSHIQGLRVRAYCGGKRPAGPGATLMGWAGGGVGNPPGSWLLLESNDAGIPWLEGSSDHLLDWREAENNAEEAQNFFLERDRQITFQCRPQGDETDRENSPAEVALDYMEVRVHYQLR